MGPQRISAEEFLQFNEQMLGLVRARVPLDVGLREMANEIQRGRLKTFVKAVSAELEGGRQLSEALEKFRPRLSDYYIALVRAGEKAGSLAEVFHHIVGEGRRRLEHRHTMTSALVYPVTVLVVACAVLAFAAFYFAPELKSTYVQLQAPIPEPTGMVIRALETLRNRLPLVVGMTASFLVVLVLFVSGYIVRSFRDALVVNLPLFGRLVYHDILITFTRCLGFLLSRGVTMPDALALTGSVLHNVHAQRFVAQVREGIEQGKSLSDMLDRHPYLPTSLRWMIRLSEERGDLGEALLNMADLYQVRQQHLRQTVRSVMQPLLIVVLGMIIGFFVISFYLGIFTIPKVISSQGPQLIR